MWLVPLEQLSADQTQAVGLDTSRNRVIVGGPGSGKTLVLAHRAEALIRDRGMGSDRVRLLVYTKVLRNYISDGLADLGLEDIGSTFDSWVKDELKAFGIPYPHGESRWSQARQRLRGHLEKQRPVHRWSALLVDEGQDLDEDALAILRLSSGHVTLAMDDRQQLYETGTDVATACRALGTRRASGHLLSAYRCTPNIVRVAAEFLPSPRLQQQFRESNLMPISMRETPVISTFETSDEELDALAQSLRERIQASQTCLVLLADNSRLRRVVRGLKERRLEVRTRWDETADPSIPLVVTYHSAKGLTTQSVFLPRLTGAAFKKWDEDQRQRLMFVGLTRATHWIWLGTVSPEPAYLSPIRRLVRENVVVTPTASKSPPAPTTGPARRDSEEDSDGMDDFL